MKKTSYIIGLAALLSSSAFAATINVTADITTNTTWNAADTYILDKVIYVKGATLDIPAGTVVRGQPDETSLVGGSLVVRPDAKIMIRGTSTNPVIFTTAALDTDLDGKVNKVGGKFVRWTSGNDTKFFDANPKTAPLAPTCTTDNESDVDTIIRTNAMWGGLIIAGDAFTNNSNQVDVNASGSVTSADVGQGIIEGLTGTDAIYGGSNESHNGGSVKYVSLRHGGLGLTADKEINALTLYAVGRDTTIENIDVYSTSDDGIEIFGGDANVKYANINYADDDGFDVDEGWRGSAQFVFVLQGKVNNLFIGDNGLELDGEDKGEGQAGTIDPLPFGKIYNFTVWNNGLTSATGNAASSAARVRAGFAGVLANNIFQNIGDAVQGNGIRIDGLVTTGTAETSPSARTNFGTGLLQVRNNAVYRFTTNYTAFTDNLVVTSAGAVSGTIFGSAIPNVYYPATNNRSDLISATDMFDVSAISHTAANGINPRPKTSANNGGYGITQDAAYVATPLVSTAYKGAFDRTASNLWTTGWTALNKRGILKN